MLSQPGEDSTVRTGASEGPTERRRGDKRHLKRSASASAGPREGAGSLHAGEKHEDVPESRGPAEIADEPSERESSRVAAAERIALRYATDTVYPPPAVETRGYEGMGRYGVGVVLLAVPLALLWLLFSDGTGMDGARGEAEPLLRGARTTSMGALAAEGGATSGLSVITYPIGATIRLDGDSIGVTPLDAHTLEAGTYLLSLGKEGYRSHQELLSIDPGERPALYLVLQPEADASSDEWGGWTSTAAGADREDGGEALPGVARTGPDTPSRVSPPAESRSTSASRRGSDERRRVSAGSPAGGQGAIPATSGRLSVLARPWGSIYIDGRLHKPNTDARYVVVLPAGTYEVEVRHPTLGSVRRSVQLEGGTSNSVILDVSAAGTPVPPSSETVPSLIPLGVAAEPSAAETPFVYDFAEEPPVLIGGLEGLHRAARYPPRARMLGIEGRVYLQFIVGEDGRVRNPVVLSGPGAGCDEEALRVISNARFVPGKMNGKAVSVKHTLFIRFQVESP